MQTLSRLQILTVIAVVSFPLAMGDDRAVLKLEFEKIVNPFIKENKEIGAAPDGVMLKIAQNNPVSFASKLDPTAVFTANEQREMLGFDQLEEDTAQQIADDQQPQSE